MRGIFAGCCAWTPAPHPRVMAKVRSTTHFGFAILDFGLLEIARHLVCPEFNKPIDCESTHGIREAVLAMSLIPNLKSKIQNHLIIRFARANNCGAIVM